MQKHNRYDHKFHRGTYYYAGLIDMDLDYLSAGWTRVECTLNRDNGQLQWSVDDMEEMDMDLAELSEVIESVPPDDIEDVLKEHFRMIEAVKEQLTECEDEHKEHYEELLQELIDQLPRG